MQAMTPCSCLSGIAAPPFPQYPNQVAAQSTKTMYELPHHQAQLAQTDHQQWAGLFAAQCNCKHMWASNTLQISATRKDSLIQQMQESYKVRSL